MTGSFTALVLQHVGRQDEIVAVSGVGIDEVIQQCPLQPCAHAGVHPVAGACQLDAPLVVDESQIGAQVHMVPGFEIEAVLLTHVTQGLVVLLAAGQQISVGQVGQAQHGGTELCVQRVQLFQVGGVLLVNLDGSAGVLRDLSIHLGGGLALLLQALLHAVGEDGDNAQNLSAGFPQDVDDLNAGAAGGDQILHHDHFRIFLRTSATDWSDDERKDATL